MKERRIPSEMLPLHEKLVQAPSGADPRSLMPSGPADWLPLLGQYDRCPRGQYDLGGHSDWGARRGRFDRQRFQRR